MTTTTEWQHRWQSALMDTYGTPPIAITSGAGAYVTDADGVDYLDFIAGIAVSSLGHAHPAVIGAVTDQVGRVAHTSNLFINTPAVRLAEKLQALTGDSSARVFLTNDGTESNECAIKLSRLHGRASDADGRRLGIVAADNGFHGRTMGSLSITGNPSKRAPFEPLPGPVTFVPYGDVDALKNAVDTTTAAVFLESTQGEGGIVPAPADYLAAAREICTAAGALLVVDEVQSGIGRAGVWFTSLATGVTPDVITLAKGLGGGLPVGACIAFGDAAGLFTPGSHGSTFGGNPVSCSAALAVLDTIEQQDLLTHVTQVGDRLRAALEAIDSPLVAQVRGSGLWLGVVLTGDHGAAVEAAARDQGLLVNAVKPGVIRFAPPLIVSEVQVDEAAAKFAAALAAVDGSVA